MLNSSYSLLACTLTNSVDRIPCPTFHLIHSLLETYGLLFQRIPRAFPASSSHTEKLCTLYGITKSGFSIPYDAMAYLSDKSTLYDLKVAEKLPTLVEAVRHSLRPITYYVQR